MKYFEIYIYIPISLSLSWEPRISICSPSWKYQNSYRSAWVPFAGEACKPTEKQWRSYTLHFSTNQVWFHEYFASAVFLMPDTSRRARNGPEGSCKKNASWSHEAQGKMKTYIPLRLAGCIGASMVRLTCGSEAWINKSKVNAQTLAMDAFDWHSK